MPHWRKGVCFTAGSTTETKSSRSENPPFFHTIPWLQSQTSIKYGMVISLELSKQDLDVFHLYIFGRGFILHLNMLTMSTWREHETASPDSSVALALAGCAKATPSSFDGWGCGAWGQVEGNSVGSGAGCAFMPQKVLESFGIIFLQNHWFYQV